MYYAHSRNDQNIRHDLVAHLRSVADQSAEFASQFDAGEIAHWLGLWHDLGKFNPKWQDYLLASEANDPNARRLRTDHKAAGAHLVIQHHLGFLALLIQGHHGGLRTPTDFQTWLSDVKKDTVEEALRLARKEMPDLEPTRPLELPPHLTGNPLAAEMYLRMLLSALVDADRLDTEAHGQAETARLRGSKTSIEELWEPFERYQRKHMGRGVEAVTTVRSEVYQACLTAANEPPALFRLTVPTGGGKTRSAMGFALRHALQHGLRRVIVAVPYISITEQTAQTYRDIFSSDPEDVDRPVVLEHHSAADRQKEDEEGNPSEVWRRLASENWDAPIIVTTTVQLFESLFANGTSPSRKLHRLARSVLILDEAQALPAHLLTPALDALQELCTHYRTTVVISTATQPAFDEIPIFANVPAQEIVPNPARHFEALKRVSYEWRTNPALSWEEIAELMRHEPQALAVVNTKKDAVALLDALKGRDTQDGTDTYHLSTLLCGAHRRDVINDVNKRLKEGAPCRLVSTQVIEAGVDLDFPLVLRALGPLDSIIQAAGRCNREGRLGPGGGRVIVFRPEEGSLPQGAYTTATAITNAMLGSGSLDPDDPAHSREYFERLFDILGKNGTDPKGIQELRESLNYPEVANRFRLIDDDTVSVVVEYGTAAQRKKVECLLDQLRCSAVAARWILRELQPYLVSLRSREADGHKEQGFVTEITPCLPRLGVWGGKYDHLVRGLVVGDRDVDSFVV